MSTQASIPADLQVGVLVGSLRRGSFNRMVAQSLPALAPAGMRIALLPSIAQIPLYDQDLFDAGIPPAVSALAQAIGDTRAVIIVTPEYNYSVPGALGGVRAQYHLRQVLVALNAQVMNLPEVLIGNVDKKVDAAAGRLTDEASLGFMRQQLVALAAFAQTHRAAS